MRNEEYRRSKGSEDQRNECNPECIEGSQWFPEMLGRFETHSIDVISEIKRRGRRTQSKEIDLSLTISSGTLIL